MQVQKITFEECSKTEKVLVIKHRGLGDAVISLGSIECLKTIFPKAQFQLAVRPWVLPMFQNTCSERVGFLSIDLESPSGWLDFIRYLRREKFDYIFEFHQVGRTAKIFNVLGWMIPGRYFFHRHFNKKSYVHDQGVNKSALQKEMDLIYSVIESCNSNPYDPKMFLNFPPKLKLKSAVMQNETKPSIILSMVASLRFRTWPVENFLQLSRLISAEFPDLQMLSPLSHNETDQEIKADIVKLDWPKNFKVIEPGLADLPVVLGSAGLFLGHDTGQKHLCVALGVKTYTFFGPSLAHEWHPYSLSDHPIFYQEDLACRTEVREYCDRQDCSHRICLKQFTPAMVFARIKADLAKISA